MHEEQIPRDFEGFKALLPPVARACRSGSSRSRPSRSITPTRWPSARPRASPSLADVQPSTLVRFAKAIGYAGFSDLQGVFRNRLRDRWPDYEERLKTLNDTGDIHRDPMRLLFGFSESATSSLERMRQTHIRASTSKPPSTRWPRPTRSICWASGAPIPLPRISPTRCQAAAAVRAGRQRRQSRTASRSPMPGRTMCSSPSASRPIRRSPWNSPAPRRERGVPVIAITDSVFSPLHGAPSSGSRSSKPIRRLPLDVGDLLPGHGPGGGGRRAARQGARRGRGNPQAGSQALRRASAGASPIENAPVEDCRCRNSRSAAADERHLGRHDRHEQDVGVQRQAGHVDAPRRRRARRPSSARPRCAPSACGTPCVMRCRHLGRGVADVDLAAGDVVLAAVERGRLGQAGDRVLGGGVGRRVRARRVGRDRAVVDDAPAARRLAPS